MDKKLKKYNNNNKKSKNFIKSVDSIRSDGSLGSIDLNEIFVDIQKK